MKKIIYILIVLQCSFIGAQTKTVVTPYGERVTIHPNADNGLTPNNGYLQLGGDLTKASVLATSGSNTLAINGLVAGAPTDKLVVLDAGGVLKTFLPSSLPMWFLGGNTNGVLQTLGTNDAFDLPFKTNNVERMRITAAGKIGIGTSTPTNNLEINGTNGIGTGLKLPTGAGSGKVLTSDADGNAIWQAAAIQMQTVAVSAGGAKPFQNTTGTDWKLIDFFSNVVFDDAKALYGAAYGWNTATNSYTVARDGKYRISLNMYALGTVSAISNGYTASAGDNWRVAAVFNNVNGQAGKSTMPFISLTVSSNDQSVFVSGVVLLKAGDIVNFKTINAATGGVSMRPALYYGANGHSIMTIESL